MEKSVAADLFFTFPGARMVRLTEDMIVARTRVRFTFQDTFMFFFINSTNFVPKGERHEPR